MANSVFKLSLKVNSSLCMTRKSSLNCFRDGFQRFYVRGKSNLLKVIETKCLLSTKSKCRYKKTNSNKKVLL